MGHHEGKDNMLGYLKVVLHLLNENQEDVDLKFGRPMRLDDLDHLTSEQMLKIVMFFLQDMIGSKPISRIVPLTEFNKLGIGNVNYDCGIDVIYQAVKQIFPEDDELFHYSVLLLPSSDPKRTKAVIAYIMEFVLMCDDIQPMFKDCFDKVIEENEAKGLVCNEIDDLNENIHAIIQQRETEKSRMPLLEKEMEKVEEDISKQQRILSNLKLELERLKGIYEEKTLQLQMLKQDLEYLNKQTKDCESEIVGNVKELQSFNASNKAKFEAQLKRRETIASNLEKLRKECGTLESLLGRANDVIQDFNSVISLMNDTKQKIESYTKSGNELTQMTRKLQQLQDESAQLTKQFSEKREEVDRRAKEHDSNLENIGSQVEKIKEKINWVTLQIEKGRKSADDVNTSISKCKEESENLETLIFKIMHDIKIGIPQERKRCENDGIKFLKSATSKFSKFPELEIDPILTLNTQDNKKDAGEAQAKNKTGEE